MQDDTPEADDETHKPKIVTLPGCPKDKAFILDSGWLTLDGKFQITLHPEKAAVILLPTVPTGWDVDHV